jgi:predicted DNA-binding protein
MARNRTVTVSVRISSELKDSLTKEASRRGMGLSAYVTECFLRSVEWVTLEDQLDFVHISKTALIALLEKIDDNDITSVAREKAAPFIRDLTYSTYGRVDLQSVLSILDLFSKYIYSKPILYSRFQTDEGETFLIRHEMSSKWSKYIAELVSEILESMKMRCVYEAANESLRLTILTNSNLPKK